MFLSCELFLNLIFTEHGDYELALRWSEPDDNGMIFFIGPDYHDGTECAAYNYQGYMYADMIGMYLLDNLHFI